MTIERSEYVPFCAYSADSISFKNYKTRKLILPNQHMKQVQVIQKQLDNHYQVNQVKHLVVHFHKHKVQNLVLVHQ